MIRPISYSRHFFKSALTILLVNLFVSVPLYYILINHEQNRLHDEYRQVANLELSRIDSLFNETITRLQQMLDVLDDSPSFGNFLMSEHRDKTALQNDMLLLTKSDSNIFQARFLNQNGQEVVRIDRSNTGTYTIVKELQDKSSRYYFRKTRSLEKRRFYVSDLDLNIEHGNIEIPLKPTLRVSKPVYRDNVFQGILILNYRADSLIEKIRNSGQFVVYYIDSQGNFLLHPDTSKNWSTQQGNDYAADAEIPHLSKLIYGDEQDTSPYYAKTITQTDHNFTIVYKIRQEHYGDSIRSVQTSMISLFFALAVASFPIVLLVSYAQSSQARLFEQIIDAIPHPMFFKDERGRFIMVNKQLVQLYGFKHKHQLIGKISYDIVDPKMGQMCRIRDQETIRNGYLKETEEIIWGKEKKLAVFEIICVKLIRFGILKKSHLLGIAIDITKLKTLNAKLKDKINQEVAEKMAMEARLVQRSKMAEMGDMVSAMIHQWKQPLNIISLNASLITARSSQADPKYNELEERIQEQTDFMARMMDDFRDFFKPNQKTHLFNPANSMEKLKTMFQGAFERKNIPITIHLHDRFNIMGHENQFMQVALNILNNARDVFLEKGQDDGRIDCYVEKRDDSTGIIRIRDNGGGIPEKLLPDKLFESHISTKGDKGTGIGLQICKNIIESYEGGRIWVHNVDEGAEFVIELPIASEQTEDASKTA